MKKLIVVVNDLERSGKSSTARAIAHHLKDLEINPLFCHIQWNGHDRLVCRTVLGSRRSI